MGDPAGIGPEICVDLLLDAAIHRRCHPLVFGDAGILARAAGVSGKPLAIRKASPANPEAWRECNVVDFDFANSSAFQPGRVCAQTGLAAYRYIESAIESTMAGWADAIVTAPIHKEALAAAGIPHPGHTEILAALTKTESVCMMLTSDRITCSLVSTHLGLAEVPAAMGTGRILEVIHLTHRAMTRLRGRRPRIVVLGLNPHAGEHGLFGNGEEESMILPAIEQARADGIDAVGPLPPDTAFLPSRLGGTDAYVCMYHDQGLIPLKMLAFDSAINVTLGLPIIRTSVDHGTALDIAWKGTANPSSLLAAANLAATLAGEPGCGISMVPPKI